MCGEGRFSRALAGLALVALTVSGGTARAGTCAEIPTTGACLGPQTITWCDGGALKKAVCPQDEICLEDASGVGGAACVHVDDTDCAGVTVAGECSSANNVVWCDAGKVAIYACGDYAQCGWNADAEEFDCLPLQVEAYAPTEDGIPGGPDPDAHPEEPGPADHDDGSGNEPPPESWDEPLDDPTASDADRAIGPTPAVSANDAELGTTVHGSGTCSGSGRAGGWWMALALLALVVRPRRLRVG